MLFILCFISLLDGTMEEDGFSNMNYITMTDDVAETEKSHFYSASKSKCFNTFKELLSQVKEQKTTQQGLISI